MFDDENVKCTVSKYSTEYFGHYYILKPESKKTRPDTRHKMRLVCVLFTLENNTGRTYGHTDLRTDTTSYRDATAHLKI